MRRTTIHGIGVAGRLLVAAGALAAGIAYGQQVNPDPGEAARDALRRQRELEEATRQRGVDRTPEAAPAVEFEDVLANPDDVALNFAWAQIQVQRGDIKGAASTLERILLVAPDQAPIRLLHAIVLFRLGRLDEAERELELVRDLPMNAALRAEIDRYRRDIAYARQRTKYALTLSFGLQYDWNRNSSPYSGQATVFDIKLPVNAADRRKSDWQTQAIARVEMTHDLGGQDNDRLALAATYVRGEQARLEQFDFQLGGVELGGQFDYNPVWVVPNVYVRRATLANQRYARFEGVNLRVEHRASGRFQVYGFGELENQTFSRTSRSVRAQERSGVQSTLGIGSAWIVHPAHRIALEVGNVWKNAREAFESYRGPTATFSHTWLFGEGVFLVTALSGEVNFYDEPERLVSARHRRDRIGRLRTTLGVPVATFVSDPVIAQSEALRDLTLFASLEGIRSRSTITANSYDNYRVAFGLTKRWDF